MYRVNGRFKYSPGISLTVTSVGLMWIDGIRALIVKQGPMILPAIRNTFHSTQVWRSPEIDLEGKNITVCC
jgi:hypothetical protein